MKGVNAIRYLYHPYHPWRHGYRREKIRRAAVKTARILLLLELLWLAYSCACSRMTEKTYLVPDIETGIPDGTVSETEGEIYGIGIEKGGRKFVLVSQRSPQDSLREELLLDFP